MRMVHTGQYYTSDKRLEQLFTERARKMALSDKDLRTKQTFLSWKTHVRESLLQITGINTLTPCDLAPCLLESTPMDGYTREKRLIQCEPNVWMPFYVMVPNGAEPSTPCIIATHGHSSSGKNATAYRIDIPAVRNAIEIYNYTYGIELVKRGYVVFCPDARGFGERREKQRQSDLEDDFLNSTCASLNKVAITLGLSLTGLWIWDLMRLVDYICSCEIYCPTRIACVGLSGGGLQSLWLAALDERIACAIVSGYFYGYKDSLLKLSENCSCNYLPHLWEAVDMGDIGALVAPRPLFIESGDQDYYNGERGVVNTTEQAQITRSAYRLLDAEENFFHHIFVGKHRWNGEKAYPFLQKNLSSISNYNTNLKTNS